jgi:CO/xanthine dehydrogenase FAD-binding subunit
VNSIHRLQDIFTPRSLKEACALLEEYEHEIRILGAGTDIILGLGKIKCLLSLSHLGLSYARRDDKSVIIGSMTTITDIADDALFDEQPYSTVKNAARLFGTRQIRNRATIGGNICSAIPSADMPVSLIALDAKVTTYGPDGERTVRLEDFIVDYRRVDLRKGELLKEIRVPLLETGSRGSFCKLSRTSSDIALVNCAVRADPVHTDFRIVLGAVGPTPIRAKAAEDFLKQCKTISRSEMSRAARIAAEQTKPISDIRASLAYRKAMSELLVYRSLAQVLES